MRLKLSCFAILGLCLSVGIVCADIDDIVIGESSMKDVMKEFGPMYSKGRSSGSIHLVSSKHRDEDQMITVQYDANGKVAYFEWYGEIRESKVESFIKGNDSLSSLGNTRTEENVTRQYYDPSAGASQSTGVPKIVHVHVQPAEDQIHVLEYWEDAERQGKILYVSYKLESGSKAKPESSGAREKMD